MLFMLNGNPAYIMETGYRERQGTSPITNKTMRFEPRFGYFQIDPFINKGRSVAISNDPRTWPDEWYDKLKILMTRVGKDGLAQMVQIRIRFILLEWLFW